MMKLPLLPKPPATSSSKSSLVEIAPLQCANPIESFNERIVTADLEALILLDGIRRGEFFFCFWEWEWELLSNNVIPL